MTTEEMQKRIELIMPSPQQIVEQLDKKLEKLKESKDEIIREAQLDYWRSVGGKEWHGVPVQEVIAWLEKQGQVKEFDISQHENKTCKENDDSLTDDERIRKELMKFLFENRIICNDLGGIDINKTLNWLKHLNKE